MALPEDFNTITITGTYMDFLGQPPVSGKIEMTPTASHIKHLASDAIILGVKREVNLNTDGTFSIQVPITNDVDVLPSFQYNVFEQITIASGKIERRYTVEVPTALLPGPVDMSDIVAIGTVPVGTTALTKTMADALYAPKGSTGGGEGGDGVDGRTPELRNSGTAIQWRYVGDPTWIDLVSLSAITGPQGVQGIQGQQGIQGIQGLTGQDGKSVELQTTATHIQWRQVGTGTWNNVIALSALKGDQGDPGVVDPQDITDAVNNKFVFDPDTIAEAAAPEGTIFLYTAEA